jgi:hypothetical protein
MIAGEWKAFADTRTADMPSPSRYPLSDAELGGPKDLPPNWEEVDVSHNNSVAHFERQRIEADLKLGREADGRIHSLKLANGSRLDNNLAAGKNCTIPNRQEVLVSKRRTAILLAGLACVIA